MADLADVDGVAQQPQDGLAGPQVAGAGAPAGVVEQLAMALAPSRSSTYLAKMACTTAVSSALAVRVLVAESRA